MASRQDKTRRQSPSGSRPRGSDSGLGSSSDQNSGAANPDRVFTAQDRREQSQSLSALREAWANAVKKADHYKKKYEKADEDLANASKSYNILKRELQQAEEDLNNGKAHIRGWEDRVKVLERDLETSIEANRRLAEENRILREKMNGAYTFVRPEDSQPEPPPLRRSSSRREKEKAFERLEKHEKLEADAQHDRLAERLNRNSSDGGSTSTRRRSRRESIHDEGWGPAARPGSSSGAMPPPSPVRGYPNYSTAPMNPPTYSTQYPPTFSQIPRSVPTGPVLAPMPPQPTTPGGYVPHPLPVRSKEKRKQ
jgi:hypothetical protein